MRRNTNAGIKKVLQMCVCVCVEGGGGAQILQRSAASLTARVSVSRVGQ
jgi:hypothetical protein